MAPYISPMPALDWPLSRDEKKRQISRLYNEDVRAADSMLSSGEATLEALRDELDSVRKAAGVQKTLPRKKVDCAGTPESPASTASQSAEVERLRTAVETAAAVLRALLPTPDECTSLPGDAERPPPRPRAQSEGAARDSSGVTIRPALCRTPRGERTKPKRKVSFGGQPEEEPMRVAAMTDSEDEEIKKEMRATPPRKHRDSLGLYGERPCHADSPSDAQPEAMVTQASDAEMPTSSITVHLKWGACSLVLAMLIGMLAFHMGAPRSDSVPIAYGDASCWVSGFRPEYCCFGPGGNPNCWDLEHTYGRCCLGKPDEDDAP